MHVRGLAKGRGPVKTGYGRARAFGVQKNPAFPRPLPGDAPAGLGRPRSEAHAASP
ncbi:hypothetical protein NY78_2927 [Desulfovibrio sp. TomC]|nr:hypothetical protein NY78_2927 [Desulfovibrio sp. TomC]